MIPIFASSYPSFCVNLIVRQPSYATFVSPFLSTHSSRLPLSDCSVVSSSLPCPPGGPRSLLGSDRLITTHPFAPRPGAVPFTPCLRPGQEDTYVILGISPRPGSYKPPSRPRPACLSPAVGFFLSLIRSLYGFCMRICCDAASSSALPSRWISSPLPDCFLMVFLLCIVFHVLSLLVVSTIHPPRLPRSVLGRGDCFFFLILVIVLHLYVHLCIQPPCRNRVYLSSAFPLPLFLVVLNTCAEIPVCLPTIPSHCVVPRLFQHFLSAACVYLALISISLPLIPTATLEVDEGGWLAIGLMMDSSSGPLIPPLDRTYSTALLNLIHSPPLM